MGVTGLWQILHPCARPIKLETLNRKRLAVDASIWIYQFLKAVRDKEGNALRNSHVVGFFRRICKLLFFGIKPVFVFDGGAPVLKRQTVNDRKKRREGRREDAVRTAGKLLAVQMQRRAEEEEQKRKNLHAQDEEVVPDEALVYVDEIGMSQKERQQTRRFKKKDAYHLPDLDVSLNEMGQPNDPRIMSLEELQAYARQFETGEDINVYDFSKIDYDSPFFMSLPASDRYNILNAARLRSRLRMGHSKEQLDSMFPDRMAFSRFQIERVTERNELTQRLMHLNESGDALFNGGGRVAGEKGREYVLVKNDGVEGGWALGVISDEGTKRETAIDVDKPASAPKQDEDVEDEDEFEDVPIEGLNRLPKRPKLDNNSNDAFNSQRKAFYKSRKSARRRGPKKTTDPDSLFVAGEPAEDEVDQWEDVAAEDELFGESDAAAEDEDADLRRAIAMSLGNDNDVETNDSGPVQDASDDEAPPVFQQSAAIEAQPLPKGSGRAIANIVNKRAYNAAPESREITSFGVPRLLSAENSMTIENEGDDEVLDFQAALAQSRSKKRKLDQPVQRRDSPPKPSTKSADEIAKDAGFSGPLPFEKLDLGSSLLGKKKMQARSEVSAGGFINPELGEKEAQKPAEPLPPWFFEDPEEGIQKQRLLEKEDLEKARALRKQFQFDDRGEETLISRSHEVIDLDRDDSNDPRENGHGNVFEILSDGPDSPASERDPPDHDDPAAGNALLEPNTQLDDVAGHASTPNSLIKDTEVPDGISSCAEPPPGRNNSPNGEPASINRPLFLEEEDNDNDGEPLDWSESEDGNHLAAISTENMPSPPLPQESSRFPGDDAQIRPPRSSRSPSAEFDDVEILSERAVSVSVSGVGAKLPESEPVDAVNPEPLLDDTELVEFDEFSDPEEEELFRQLTLEAEEHARFASSLNNKPQAQNAADYEKELKQLRNQQKKDRRDADEVTHIMISECQQLLRLFGLPYVTAPMEAEAQCAELVRLGLVDGIVTDDSDCFLFGGTRIYKNMFNQAKFVECYLTSDLEKEFDLTRDKLIQVAHLLGSDYTEGLPGVGPVTALEILSEFATLQDFREWWSGVQMNTIPKTLDATKPFRKKFRRNATKLFLPPAFPDVRVDLAYQQPEVDSDPEAFQWGVPDLDALRSFLMATIGWSQERTDEVLVPVIRDMNRRADEGTQSNITAFFDGGVGIGSAGAPGRAGAGGATDVFAPRKVAESSKRMGSALTRMAEQAKRYRGQGTVGDGSGGDGGESAGDGHEVVSNAPPKSKSKSKAKRAKPRKRRSDAVD